MYIIQLGMIELQLNMSENDDGDDDIIYLTGINQNHFGIETEFAAQINDMFRADMGISYGKWEFTDDATGTYRDSDGSDASYSYALKDLPTGDMYKHQ